MNEELVTEIDREKLHEELKTLHANQKKTDMFLDVLSVSIKEINELLDAVTRVLEHPEIVENEEDRLEICDLLKEHKASIVEIGKKMEQCRLG